MSKNKTIRSFEELRHRTDCTPVQYSAAAKKVVQEGLISAFNSQMVECRVKVYAIHNGTLQIEIYDTSKKAEKEQRNFSLYFNMHGKAIRNLAYHGPVLRTERVSPTVNANRDVNLNVGVFTRKMGVRREKIRQIAEEQRVAAMKIQQHDRNVAVALEIFVRDTIQTLYKKVVF